jgi:hypothetical protein
LDRPDRDRNEPGNGASGGHGPTRANAGPGATREGIFEAAKEDYRALLREHAGLMGLEAQAQRSA